VSSDPRMLRRRVLAAIQAGRLPNRQAERTWGGVGSGLCCVGCGQPIEHHESEYELQFGAEDGRPSSTYLLHVQCFVAWESELGKPLTVAAQSQDQPPDAPVRAGAENLPTL
jgi:hypothetical protein